MMIEEAKTHRACTIHVLLLITSANIPLANRSQMAEPQVKRGEFYSSSAGVTAITRKRVLDREW